MKRFQKGQKVVCVGKGKWFLENPIIQRYFFGLLKRTIRDAHGPSFNEIVTCDGYTNTGQSIFLEEYSFCIDGIRAGWLDKYFEPLVSDEVLEEELKSIGVPEVKHG